MLLQRLYFIYAEEKASNNNFHNEKMGVINFLTEQLENIVDTPKARNISLDSLTVCQKVFLRKAPGSSI